MAGKLRRTPLRSFAKGMVEVASILCELCDLRRTPDALKDDRRLLAIAWVEASRTLLAV